MATDGESSFLDTLPDSEVTEEDEESAQKKADELTESDFQYIRPSFEKDPVQGERDTRERYRAAAYERTLAARENARKRREYGLEGDLMYEYANKQAEIAAGTRKTAGEISAEKELAIMASGQRGAGRSRGRGSFDVAEALRLGGMSAQGVESEGGAMIGAAAEKAKGAAAANLEQLLITGQERAADQALQMERLQMQQDQAGGALWSNVLSGVLGALGGAIGFVATGGNPLGAAAGFSAGSSGGKAFGSYVG